MAVELDHLILKVNDRARSIDFYTQVLGLAYEEEDGPFSVIRVTPSLQILLSPGGAKGGEHLAFSMSRREFEEIFARLKEGNIPFGDRFDAVGNMQGPGDETGARGLGKSLYFFDPNDHLIEIRYY